MRHNKLIESQHRLSLIQRRFVLWVISQVERDDEDFKAYRITVKDWENFCCIKPTDNTYKVLFKMANGLSKCNVGIETRDKAGKRQFEFFNWFYKLRYLPGEGAIFAIIHPDLKPYILQLKEQYTAIALEYALLLRRPFSHRIYDFLKQYERIGERVMQLDYLRQIMELESGQYHRYRDFRRFVLETAQREISDKTDISFTFEPIKHGRKIVSVRFLIKTKNPTVTLENREESDPEARTLFRKLLSHGIETPVARNLIANYENDRIAWHIEDYERRKKSGQDKKTGWLVNGIKKDYRPQKSMFEEQEEEQRRATEKKRQEAALIGSEIDRLKKECDDLNRKSYRKVLEKLPSEKKKDLDEEFLRHYGQVPLFRKKFQEEGFENHMLLAMYIPLLKNIYPDSGMSYREYAEKKGASKAVLAAIETVPV